jgi:serine/threonine-protein kinase
MQLAPGAMVTPTVRLVRPLRSGGMGHVWLADHIGLHVPVAVKFIADKLALDDPSVRAQFEQEARTAARIKSQHVVQTHDCGIMGDGTPYIVMELLEGESLQDRLDREKVLSLPETIRVVSQVATALHRAHKLNIVHRDIKPANIFLCATDEGMLVKVLDFGLAQAVKPPGIPAPGSEPAPAAIEAAPNQPDVMVGTLPFLRPETLAGEQHESHHADLWALGVVTYRCLVGRFPFTGTTPGLLCLSIMTGRYVAPSDYRPELPPTVDVWFMRVFHGEQERRFQSAREMALALAAAHPSPSSSALFDDDSHTFSGLHAMAALHLGAAGHHGTLESGPTVLPALVGRSRRRTWWAALGGFMLAAGVAAVVIAIALGSEPNGAEPSGPSAGVDSASADGSREASAATSGSSSPGPQSSIAVTPSADAGTSLGNSPAGRPSIGVVPGRPASPPPTGKGRQEDYGF